MYISKNRKDNDVDVFDMEDLKRQMRLRLPEGWEFDTRHGLFVITKPDGTSVIYHNRRDALAYADGVNDVTLSRKDN